MKCYKCLQDITPGTKIEHGLHEHCFLNWFNLTHPKKITNLARHANSTDQPHQTKTIAYINTSFFKGKFKKYSAYIGQTAYILKIQEEEFPELPAVEYLCNQLAQQLQIQVPPYYLIKLQNEVDCFVSKNFMQDYSDSNLVHIYHHLSSGKEYCCEKLLSIIKEKTQHFINIKRFFELCFFDALIGNHDRHGRNLAFVQNKFQYKLSPFYDNPSYLGIEAPFLLGAQHEPRGKIATQTTDNPKMSDYVIEFKRLGYDYIIKDFYKKINFDAIKKLIADALISNERKKAISSLISRRLEELHNGLQQ